MKNLILSMMFLSCCTTMMAQRPTFNSEFTYYVNQATIAKVEIQKLGITDISQFDSATMATPALVSAVNNIAAIDLDKYGDLVTNMKTYYGCPLCALGCSAACSATYYTCTHGVQGFLNWIGCALEYESCISHCINLAKDNKPNTFKGYSPGN